MPIAFMCGLAGFVLEVQRMTSNKQPTHLVCDAQAGAQNAFCDLSPRLRRALYARLERRLVNLISYAAHINKPLYMGRASAQQEPELAILDKLLREYDFALTWHKSGQDTLVFLEPQRPLQPFAEATVRAVPAASVPAMFAVAHHADNDAETSRDHHDRPVTSSAKDNTINVETVNPETVNLETVNLETVNLETVTLEKAV